MLTQFGRCWKERENNSNSKKERLMVVVGTTQMMLLKLAQRIKIKTNRMRITTHIMISISHSFLLIIDRN